MKKNRLPEEKPTKSVGIWLRVSTEDQARGESPEHHEKRARYYAASKEWEVKEVYHLEGVSGKSVSDHPETQRMLEDIKTGHITGLIFSKIARLARNTRELLDFADIFRENNADLISLQESIDTSTPSFVLYDDRCDGAMGAGRDRRACGSINSYQSKTRETYRRTSSFRVSMER